MDTDKDINEDDTNHIYTKVMSVIQWISVYKLNYRALLAGSFTVVLLLLINRVLQNSGTSEEILLGFAALAIGTSFGYQLGEVAKKEKENEATSFILGLLITLSGVILYQTSLDITGMILIVATVNIFLIYSSGLVSRNDDLKRWIAKGNKLSWFVLVIIVFVEFAAPKLWNFIKWASGQLVVAIDFISNLTRREAITLSIFIILSLLIAISIKYIIYDREMVGTKAWKKR